MPVYVDQNGNYYFNAIALSVADYLVASARADLVTALTAVSPGKRQVSFQGENAPILLPAVDIPDSSFAAAPSTGNRKILTALHPNGEILANDSFVVPDGIYQMWADLASGGGGGGGGNATPGGGGGGGGSGALGWKVPISVFPGETITVAIPAGGPAGAAGVAGTTGGIIVFTGSISGTIISLAGGPGGSVGANPNGGTGGSGWASISSGGAGGAGAGANSNPAAVRTTNLVPGALSSSGGGGGGALNFNGGNANPFQWANGSLGGTGGAAGGGGGGGGCSLFGSTANAGRGGIGGNNGAAGNEASDPTSYGAGGGGGSGNAAGANGVQGFARFYY